MANFAEQLKKRSNALGIGVTSHFTNALLREAVEEIERLQAIVDQLLKTADGVPITVGMTVFVRAGTHGSRIGTGVVTATRRRDCSVRLLVTAGANGEPPQHTVERRCPANLYSTEAALEEARKS